MKSFLGIVINADEKTPVERDFSDQPLIIEGADLYDAIAPVSSLTGRRENVVSLLSRLQSDPEMSRVMNVLLQELPSIQSDPRLTDEDRINLLTERLSVGTPAEDDAVRRRLESVADILFANSPHVVKDVVSDGKISFNPEDAASPQPVIDSGVHS